MQNNDNQSTSLTSIPTQLNKNNPESSKRSIYSTMLYNTLSGKPIPKFTNIVLNSSSRLMERRSTVLNHPCRILDAPNLIDDFYTNVLDWMPDSEKLSVALGEASYLWDESLGSNSLMFKAHSNDLISCNKFISDSKLFVSITGGAFTIDLETQKQSGDLFSPSDMKKWEHYPIIISSSRNTTAYNSDIFVCGTKTGNLYINDYKSFKTIDCIRKAHKSDVCGIEWSEDGTFLATGSDDKLVKIWDLRMNLFPLIVFDGHTAAIKAIDWNSKKHNTIVTGGGLKDSKIIIWNAFNGDIIEEIDSGSQVCGIKWLEPPIRNKNIIQKEKIPSGFYEEINDDLYNWEVVSAHGDALGGQKHELNLWRYTACSVDEVNRLESVVNLLPHKNRILHMTSMRNKSSSGDRSLIVTGAPNESLKFWDFRDSDNPSVTPE
eukprot:GHVP01063022.1.p1 GENE.GHVP01063022.1~~GHVP01063022.1.p1  ORF type:complete len:433 (-),score=59.12 GHVP01063022.1:336-1634(-)